jgi:hypothetical protein
LPARRCGGLAAPPPLSPSSLTAALPATPLQAVTYVADSLWDSNNKGKLFKDMEKNLPAAAE